jgi:uncharacterized protein
VEKRFVVDTMLGKLAKWLRILGFDTRYEALRSREQIEVYEAQGFFLITRNRRWSGKARTICLSANESLEQLREIIALVPLTPKEIRLLQRCVRCNELLEKTPREQALGSVPDYIFETHASFYQCPECRRLFWPGSHPERIMERLRQELGWTMTVRDLEANPRPESQEPTAKS